MENSPLTPKDKIQLCMDLVKSPAWALLCVELDEQIKFINNDISNALRRKNFDAASRLDGKKEMAEALKVLPFKIKRQNEGIIERIKNLLPGSRI